MKAICLLLIALLAPLGLAARTASDFFASAPDQVVRLLPQSTRLDMLDYFKFGSTRPSSNVFGGEAIMRSVSDGLVGFDVDKGVAMQIAVIPSAAHDTVIALVTTLATPSLQSSIEFYDKDWAPLKNTFFRIPAYDDWLSPEGLADRSTVALHLPFMPVSYSFDPDVTMLRAHNEAEAFLDKDEYKALAPRLIINKVYDLTFPKFKLQNVDTAASGN